MNLVHFPFVLDLYSTYSYRNCMHRTELVAALEEHLWAQLTLAKVAGTGRSPQRTAPEIGFGVAFVRVSMRWQ